MDVDTVVQRSAEQCARPLCGQGTSLHPDTCVYTTCATEASMVDCWFQGDLTHPGLVRTQFYRCISSILSVCLQLTKLKTNMLTKILHYKLQYSAICKFVMRNGPFQEEQVCPSHRISGRRMEKVIYFELKAQETWNQYKMSFVEYLP